MQDLNTVFQKNGSVIGLKLNGSVISTVNNIDSLLAKKADKAIVDEVVELFKTGREEFDKFKEESVESIKTKIDLAFFYDYMTSIFDIEFRFTYTCGYATTPTTMKTALLKMVSDLYEYRESSVEATKPSANLMTAYELMKPFKRINVII